MRSLTLACVCYLRKTHGLPCVHELFALMQDGKSIELQDIHPFWKTLDMEVVKDSVPDSDEENKLLQLLFDRMIQQPRNVKRRYIEELEKIVNPEWTNLKEPLVRQTKGRSKKKCHEEGSICLGICRKEVS